MRFRIFLTIALLGGSVGGLRGDHEWNQFRGPDGNGHFTGTGLPRTWSETENIRWKTPIHDRGWGSPVIWGDQVWLTTATQDGRQLYALCVDRESGKVVFDQKLFDVADPQFCHKFNSYASPTPVIEAGRVYVTFGSPGTACIDTGTFQVLWTRTDIECNHFRGAGSSPILHGDLLIMNYDGSDHQFVLALDKRTGKTVWRTKRSIDYQDLGPDGKPEADGDWRKAFATPHVAALGGRDVLISEGAKAIYGYDPLTGREYWRVEERANHSASTRPVVGHGLIYYPTGFSRGQLNALRPDGKGVLDHGKHLAWTSKRSVPNKPSPILVGNRLYTIDDGGIATCYDAANGRMIWNERVGGNYSASPVFADGVIWFFSEQGKCTGIAPGDSFKVVAENQLGDGFMASPALAGKSLFLRSKSHLYRVEK